MTHANYAKRISVAELEEILARVGASSSTASALIDPQFGGRLAREPGQTTEEDLTVIRRDVRMIARALEAARRSLVEMRP